MGWFGPGFVAATLQQVPQASIHAETDFVAAALQLRRPARVLDIGCGLGRHAAVLASHGHGVLACDSDAYTIGQARQILPSNLSDRVDLRHATSGDLYGDLDLDCAYSLMSPLGFHTDRGADRDFLLAVREVLPAGARFVLDYPNLLPRLSRLTDSGVRELPDGRRVLTIREFDVLTCRSVRSRIVLGSDGSEQYVDQAVIRLYHPHEIMILLREAGFEPITVCGWFNGSQFQWDSPRIIIICRTN